MVTVNDHSFECGRGVPRDLVDTLLLLLVIIVAMKMAAKDGAITAMKHRIFLKTGHLEISAPKPKSSELASWKKQTKSFPKQHEIESHDRNLVIGAIGGWFGLVWQKDVEISALRATSPKCYFNLETGNATQHDATTYEILQFAQIVIIPYENGVPLSTAIKHY